MAVGYALLAGTLTTVVVAPVALAAPGNRCDQINPDKGNGPKLDNPDCVDAPNAAATPELDSLTLLGVGAAGAGGYLMLRRRREGASRTA